jgi:hypothetical protein
MKERYYNMKNDDTKGITYIHCRQQLDRILKLPCTYAPSRKEDIRRSRSRWNEVGEEWRTDGRGEDMNWIHLALDRVQWRIFVSTIMNLRVALMREF